MHALARPAVALGTALIVVAGCTGSGGTSATPAPTADAPGPTPVGSASPTPAPGEDDYWLRLTLTQAIPPLNQFAVQPPVRITGDGTVVTLGPVPAIYPGPLLPNTVGRSISDAGRDQIIGAARDLGLLSGTTDFMGDNPLMGGVTGHIELTVDGQRVTLTGDPDAQIVCVTAPCDPAPGTPEAFGELWRMLNDLASWMPDELGPEAPYEPAAYSILVGQPPAPEEGLPQAPADWPLDQSLATFGGPVANGTARCGNATGADAQTLRPALQAANQLTPWVDDPDTSATFGLTVRPLVPGEDACVELFGL
jgi:hypothetical protein